MTRISAGELSRKASSDTTKYDALEVGYGMTEDIGKKLRICIDNHKHIIDEPEFCVIMQKGEDKIIKNLIRRKFYCWPYLPSPRPNQAVFLYNKAKDDITKRLWILPNAIRMATLAENISVKKEDLTMQAWSIAFFKGRFWEYIRHEHDIDMLSEHEYFLANRDELLKAGCKLPDSTMTNPFDFDKISIEKIIDTKTAIAN